MKRDYTLFVTDDTLLASPYVRRFNFLHDLTLHLRQAEEVSFLLQEALTPQQREALTITYDEVVLEVEKVKVIPFTYQTLIRAVLTPKELGTIRISFSYPKHTYKRLPRKVIPTTKKTTALALGSPFDSLRFGQK